MVPYDTHFAKTHPGQRHTRSTLPWLPLGEDTGCKRVSSWEGLVRIGDGDAPRLGSMLMLVSATLWTLGDFQRLRQNLDLSTLMCAEKGLHT